MKTRITTNEVKKAYETADKLWTEIINWNLYKGGIEVEDSDNPSAAARVLRSDEYERLNDLIMGVCVELNSIAKLLDCNFE